METRDRSSRFDHIDGLRGVAVLLVVLFHAWQTSALATDHGTPVARLFSSVLGEGEQGVSLFLVISGFCLAYPMLRRRARADSTWLNIREFAARRVYRIMPPYYAALGLFSVAAVAFQVRGIWPLPMSMNVPPDSTDLVAHLLFIHNVTSHPFTINASFWSLGLEWQWYFVFPVLLLAYLRLPRLTLVACAALAVFWGGVLPILLGSDNPWVFRLWLPGRLLEFAFGIAAAQLLVSKRVISAWLGLGTLVLGGAVVALLHVLHMAWLALPMWGIVWAGLLLLSLGVPRVRRALSIRPLARLGVVSYSVYLIHEPVTELVNAVVRTDSLAATLGAILLSSSLGIAAGVLFFWIVERPLLRPETWARYGPHLLRWFGAAPANSRAVRPTAVAAQAE